MTSHTGPSLQFSFFTFICPDDVAYDWATATLKDNTTGVTATPLAQMCTNTGAWNAVTAAVTAGHSYRSEERRVGKECRSGSSQDHYEEMQLLGFAGAFIDP